MKVCIYGAGGVGGYLAVRLHNAGIDIAIIARGKMLDAIRSQGLRLNKHEESFAISKGAVKVTDDPSSIGSVDLVISCAKSWQLEDFAHGIAPLLKPDSIVLPLQNGIESHEILDGILGGNRTLMGLAYMFSYIEAPGVIRNDGGAQILYGECKSDRTDRVDRLNALFRDVDGVQASNPSNIEHEVWKKFMRISAISGMGAITRAPILSWKNVTYCFDMFQKCLKETGAIANKACGLQEDFDMSFFERVTDKSMTSSMARDMLQGRPSEMETLIGAVVRHGKVHGVPTPTYDFIYATLLLQEQKARGIVDFLNKGVDDI